MFGALLILTLHRSGHMSDAHFSLSWGVLPSFGFLQSTTSLAGKLVLTIEHFTG